MSGGGEFDGDQSVHYMLGSIAAKIDGLIASLNTLREDHFRHVGAVSNEITVLKSTMERADTALDQRITREAGRVDDRLNHVEAAIAAAAVERSTMARIGGVVVAIASGLWAIVTFAAPYFSG